MTISKEKKKEYSSRYYEKHKEDIKKKTKERPSSICAREKYRSKPETKARNRANLLFKTYGITVEEYERMLENQKHCCAGCGTHQLELKQRLHVDHDHETGVVRGLLCGNCNRALGLVKDNPKTLQSLINYLGNQDEC
jgi:5-methylcytosine-specific restriction endonuclease McrA